MSPKTTTSLLSFILLATIMWFSGHLYKSILLGRTILFDPVGKMLLWNKLFTRSDELLYYLPLLVPVSGLLPVLVFPFSDRTFKRNVWSAGIFIVAAMLLSVYMMRRANFDLLHGDLTGREKQFYAAALRWNVLNGLRIVLIGTGLFFLYKTRNRSWLLLSEKRQ